MSKILSILVVGVVFYLSWIAYEKVEQHTNNELQTEVNALRVKMTALSAQVQHKDAELAGMMHNKEVEFAAKQDEQRRLIKILVPSSSEQIDKIFALPYPVPASEKTEVPKQEEKK